MARLRVIQVVISLNPGGTERLVIELVRRTRDRCVSFVCCLEDEGLWAGEVTREGVPVTALKREPGFRPALGRRIARLARQYQANVLHCHQYSAFVYGRLAAGLGGPGLVFTEHGRLSDAPPSLKRRLVNPLLGRMSGRMFAVSYHLRDHMIREGFPDSRLAVIHNGIDPADPPSAAVRCRARSVLGLSGDVFVAGTAARLDAVKDLTTLIDAFAALCRERPASRLVVFGDGPERQHLEQHAMSLGVSGAVLFTGHRPDVRSLLPALDVYANSSTSEGISLTILEAMAAELPVIATAVGGTPEVVIPDRTGVLVSPRAAGALREALLRIAAEPELRRAFGTAGRARMLEHFTIDRMVDAYVTQYERAAERAV
jgi:glycosyltransferase involved in cell wall biosynthesis